MGRKVSCPRRGRFLLTSSENVGNNEKDVLCVYVGCGGGGEGGGVGKVSCYWLEPA